MFLNELSLEDAKIESHRMLINDIGEKNLQLFGLNPKDSLSRLLDIHFSNDYNVFETEIISNDEFEHRYNNVVNTVNRIINHVYGYKFAINRSI